MEGEGSKPSERNVSAIEVQPQQMEKKKVKKTIFHVYIAATSSKGVHLAEEGRDGDEEQYFEVSDEFDCPDYDDLCYANMKNSCSFRRSVAKNKTQIGSHRSMKVAVQRRAVKIAGNVLENRKAHKENVDTRLRKRGIQRWGLALYARRADTATFRHRKNKSHVTKTLSSPAHNNQDHPAVLRYELRSDNIPKEAGCFMADIINLQHRDLGPEDYELLLQLDEAVAPKTVSRMLLDSIGIVTVDVAGILNGEVCTICMELYQTSQKVKTLPCEHTFHADCIDLWLSTASQTCPLDGLVFEM